MIKGNDEWKSEGIQIENELRHKNISSQYAGTHSGFSLSFCLSFFIKEIPQSYVKMQYEIFIEIWIKRSQIHGYAKTQLNSNKMEMRQTYSTDV